MPTCDNCGLGIHKFYLGASLESKPMTTAGIIMLLVTICTFGIGGIVFTIIALIEAILYLTATDAAFYQKYAVQKTAWF